MIGLRNKLLEDGGEDIEEMGGAIFADLNEDEKIVARKIVSDFEETMVTYY